MYFQGDEDPAQCAAEVQQWLNAMYVPLDHRISIPRISCCVEI